MKKYIFSFALLVLLVTQTMAQTSVYHPFPDSNAVWTGLHEWDTGEHFREDYQQFINGDTMIGSNSYHKIYESGIYSDWISYPFDFDTSYYYFNRFDGSFRETTSKKVFFCRSGSSFESLLYDFNLSLGDTLQESYINDSANEHTFISQIDSIFDGTNYRKQYHLSSDFRHNFVSLIEGIGSTFGFFEPLGQGEYIYRLHCFMSYDTIRYSDSTTQACNLSVGVNENQNEKMNLSPNPATNQLTIHTSSFHDEAATVSIMNVMGQEASPPAPLQRRGESATVDVSGLAAGMYFLQVRGESGSVVKRFVKE